MYSRELERLLTKEKVLEGDIIEVAVQGSSYRGILLPRISEVEEDIITLKLDNGYNIGLQFKPGISIKKISPSEKKLAGIPKLQIRKSGLPSIAFIATGGTIATHLDYRTGAVYMSRTPEELLSTTPELQEIVNIKSISAPFLVASEDIGIDQWKKLAEETASKLNDPEVKGAVIAHGTDAMHYSSAALAFMLQDLSKPVAFVGAQRSPDRGSFDGSVNLLCGAYFAAYSDIAEVAIVMHGSSSDDFCYAHRGVKARKMHTSRRDAFRSINDLPLAKIFPEGKIEVLNPDHKKRQEPAQKIIADAAMEKKVAMLKIHPAADPDLLDYLTGKKYRGVILEAMALGHVPTGESGLHMGDFEGRMSWLPAVKRAAESGMFVAVTSQSLYGRTSSSVYRNLRLLRDAGAVHCEDMLPETAFVKLCWALAHSKNQEETKKMMLSNLRGEINSRLLDSHFLQ